MSKISIRLNYKLHFNDFRNTTYTADTWVSSRTIPKFKFQRYKTITYFNTPLMKTSAIILSGVMRLNADVAIREDVKKQPLKQKMDSTLRTIV